MNCGDIPGNLALKHRPYNRGGTINQSVPEMAIDMDIPLLTTMHIPLLVVMGIRSPYQPILHHSTSFYIILHHSTSYP